MDKVDKQSLLLWGVVAYSVALLLYCSLKVLSGSDANYISAFGSILSALATIFASFVAIYIFNGWKNQHNKSIIADEAKATFNRIHKERNIIHELKFLLEDLQGLNSTNLPDFKALFLGKLNDLEDIHNSNNQPTDELINLLEDSNLYSVMVEYNDHLDTFQNFDKARMASDFEIYISITLYIKKAEELNQKVLQELKEYIFA
ncbi:hypothetical protein NRA60_13395 [Acinetobacter baumannii]|nr:hypothetical protein [Acinetobacter baumannii]